MVTAGVSAGFSWNGFANRGRGLGDAGEGIVFGQHPDDRVSGSVAGNESGGNAGDTGFNGETLVGQGLF